MTRPAPDAPAIEVQAWAVLGADGKIAEVSAYLMAFADERDAVAHALPDQGERAVPVTIRIGEGLPREVDG